MGSALWKLVDVGLGDAASPRLEGVTLEIGEGATAVVGYSGAGKTSLLNLLVGFERPDRGEIVSNVAAGGREGRPDGFALPVYWVPQTGGLWPHVTAAGHLEAVAPGGKSRPPSPTCSAETAASAAKARRLGSPPAQASAKDGRDEIVSLLAAFDIAEKAESRPGEMSQGEQARLAVARALAADAAVLVMDEPFSNVDPARTGRYWDEVRARLDERGASLVFATHSPRDVLREAERVICLKEGRVIAEGTVEDVYRRPETREVAECLGETNWLTPAEARRWLGREEPRARSFRPEEIAVEPAKDGPLVVRRSRFQGSVAEVELARDGTGETIRLLHRPSAPSADGLRAGLRASIRLTVALLVACAAGCRDGEAPSLAVKEWRVWPVPPVGTRLPAPRAAAAIPQENGGGFIVLDTAARVLVYDAGGKLARSWRMPEREAGNPEGACWLDRPFAGRGRIAVADTHYHRVVFFDEEGNETGRLGKLGRGKGEFIYPVAITRDATGNVYVCEYGSNDRVQKFDRDGRLVAAFGAFGTGGGEFQRPSGIVWHDGKVYVADAINGRIQEFADDGRFLGVLGRGAAGDDALALDLPYEIALGPGESLYVAEYGAGRVSRLSLGGAVLGRYGRPGTGRGEFRTPWGLAVDGAGRILVADTKNRRLVMLTQEAAR